MFRYIAVLALVASLSTVSSVAVEVLISETGTIGSMKYDSTDEGTGLTCAMYTMALTAGATSGIMTGVFTTTDASELENRSYGSVDAFVTTATTKAVDVSFCDAAHYAESATCTKTVTLDATETYIGVIETKGTLTLPSVLSLKAVPHPARTLRRPPWSSSRRRPHNLRIISHATETTTFPFYAR